LINAWLEGLEPEQLQDMLEIWPLWARPAQMPPQGPWRTWLFLGGRGAGKTRAAAEWVRERMESGACASAALIAPTLSDAREVMIEGPSGLRAIASTGFRPRYESSRRRLVWPDGRLAHVYSAEDPDSLRGPQFDCAWGDEVAAWPLADRVLDTLRPAMRMGADPRAALTTTPRAVPAVKRLLGDPSCVVTRAATRENAANLAPGFVGDLEARWAGSVWARQELGGELIEDPAGALWSRAEVDAARARLRPESFDRIVVAVDPPASAGPRADACGIVVAGATGTGRGRMAAVLADRTVQGRAPTEWASAVASAFDAFSADCIVCEANQGGEMARTLLRLAAPDAPVRLVHAGKAKRLRAEPVAILYAQGRVAHAPGLTALEDEMCAFGAPGFAHSPDRVDALVWALTDLLLNTQGAPAARSL
jgi:phage terminase large subunit-like protein